MKNKIKSTVNGLDIPSGMSFDHVMATACAWTITLLYIYLCV